MTYKEQMAEWIEQHPEATIEQAWQAGYECSTNAWCHGKVSMMEQCRELMKQILS